MTKIDIVSGFLGAGKTTLINRLIHEAYQGEKIVLIENEFGEIGIDSGFLQDSGVKIAEMNSGCICCSLVGDFSKALGDNSHRVDSVLKNVASLSDSLVAAQLPTMVSEATRAMAQLNKAMTDINEGKGTVGALMENKELYDSLVKATSNLSLLLEDLKANPKRYVHFSLFGRKDK